MWPAARRRVRRAALPMAAAALALAPALALAQASPQDPAQASAPRPMSAPVTPPAPGPALQPAPPALLSQASPATEPSSPPAISPSTSPPGSGLAAQPAAPDSRTTVGVQAQRTLQARNHAASCTGCHGPDGRAPAGSPIPGLAGRPQAEIVEQMLAYKSGRRAGTVMPQIAKGYSDGEIVAIAAWFADVK